MEHRIRSMGPMEWLFLLTLSILWGGSFFFVSVALQGLPRFTIIGLRVGIAALALNLILLSRKQRLPREKGLWKCFFLMGLLNNVIPFSLIVWGQTHISGGLASILNAVNPFFTVLVAHFLTKDEKMTSGRILGVIIGFTGVVFIMGPSALKGLGANTLAQLAILAASLSYTFAGIYGRRFRAMGISPLATATGQITASAVMAIPLALVLEKPWQIQCPPLRVWGAVLGIALLSTALAYILYFRILATSGASNVLLVTFLNPVSAILLGVTILGEPLVLKQLAGMLFIGLGLAAIDGRLPRLILKVSRRL